MAVNLDHLDTGSGEKAGEPGAIGTRALDPELVGEVLRVMRSLADEGRTMLIVTHEMNFARDVSDRVIFLHQGLVEDEGPPAELFSNSKSERFRQFIANERT